MVALGLNPLEGLPFGLDLIIVDGASRCHAWQLDSLYSREVLAAFAPSKVGPIYILLG